MTATKMHKKHKIVFAAVLVVVVCAAAHAQAVADGISAFEHGDKNRAKLLFEQALKSYRENDNVLYAEPNYLIEALAVPNDASFSSQWNLRNTGQNGGTPGADMKAVQAWDITTGSSDVVVAVIDTGVDYTHQDLVANMWRNEADCNSNGIDDDHNGYTNDCYGIDTFNGDSNPLDDNNHGTHVAGIIGAALASVVTASSAKPAPANSSPATASSA